MCSCLSIEITCVFSAGVARFPKPRLASFLGRHSPLATADSLLSNLLLAAFPTWMDAPYSLDLGVPYAGPLAPLLNKFFPMRPLDCAAIQIVAPFPFG